MTTPTDKSEVTGVEALRAWCKTDDRSAPIEEICDAIEAYDHLQSQLTDLRAQVEQSNHNLEMARSEIEARRSLLDELIKERDSLTAQVERLHADGAVMRGGLDLVRSMLKVYSAGIVTLSQDDYKEVQDTVDKALATSCGSDLLDRYRESVELVRLVREERPEASDQMSPDWASRADALLTRLRALSQIQACEVKP